MSLPRIISILAIAGLFAGLMSLVTGCVELDPQTQKSIHDSQQKAAIDAAKVKDAQQVKDAKGMANPVLHPFAANDETIREIRAGCIWLARVATVATVILFGLTFSPWGLLVKPFIIPAGLLAVLGWVGTFALPFLPWIIGAGLIGAVALAVERIVKMHGFVAGLSQTASDLKTILLLAKPGSAISLNSIGATPAK